MSLRPYQRDAAQFLASRNRALTADRLREVLAYDPLTGVFVWRATRGRAAAGSVAGTRVKGYCEIRIDGVRYFAHRLAWLYTYGVWPVNGLDHINRDPTDNRIVNLRDVSGSINNFNTSRPRHNTSGVKGVYFHRARRKWVAQIKIEGRARYLGLFDTLAAAASARVAEERRLGLCN